MPLILIGGGSRSGKSRHALTLARSRGSRLAFVATAQASDDEMRDRIGRHREERGSEFTTFEEPLAVAGLIQRQSSAFDAIVVDCLTLWLSNLIEAQPCNVEAEACRLIDASMAAPCAVILVTNEVGCGIVPENELARRFRDEAGRLNQAAARQASEAYWMIFGLPLRVK